PGHEALVLEDLLDERAHLLAARRTRLGLECPTTFGGELLQRVGHGRSFQAAVSSAATRRTSSITSCHHSSVGRLSSPSRRRPVAANSGLVCQASQWARLCQVPMLTRLFGPSSGS